MDFQTSIPKYTTTIAIPVWLAKEIKSNGMSYGGALVAGWNAIQERKEWQPKMIQLEASMQKYRSEYIKLRNQMLSAETDNGMEFPK